MQTPIVTLTTDWGERGIFAGMVKGALLRLLPQVQVVDISHRLEAYNVMTASFVVSHACLGFPEGTVHLIDVACQPPFIVVHARGQYFICSDNGLPSQVFGTTFDEVIELPLQAGGVYNFAAYNLFVPTAVRLLQGVPLAQLGAPYPQFLQRNRPTYLQQGDYYRIYVHYVDDYGNAYLGMTYEEFERLRAGRHFVLQVRDMEVRQLSTSYFSPDATNDYGLQLTVSATGVLELALPQNSLAQLSGIRPNESVLLSFRS